jgi:hypothetical protein
MTTITRGDEDDTGENKENQLLRIMENVELVSTKVGRIYIYIYGEREKQNEKKKRGRG